MNDDQVGHVGQAGYSNPASPFFTMVCQRSGQWSDEIQNGVSLRSLFPVSASWTECSD
jgi:hypothetical protein